MPRLIEVIESEINRGRGDAGSPVRLVVQYHTLKGQFLCEHDPWRPEEDDEEIAHRRKRKARLNRFSMKEGK